MGEILHLKMEHNSRLKVELKNLYKEIIDDKFSNMTDENIRMSYFTQRRSELFTLLRKHQKLSLVELAQKVGINTSFILELESPYHIPDEGITGIYVKAIGATRHVKEFLDLFER